MSDKPEMTIVRRPREDTPRERWAKEQLAELQRRYQLEAQPYFDVLMEEDMAHPAVYYLVPLTGRG